MNTKFLKRRGIFLCLSSAVLLILAFPKTDFWLLSWAALIPLFFLLDDLPPGRAFRWAGFCGLIFFAGTLYWFVHVTVLGALLLFFYLALYFGFFGWVYSCVSRRRFLLKLFFLPSVWVSLEFLRAHAFTGFDWAGLGYSQYKNLNLIQIADITGVFGVSFLIIQVNLLLKEVIQSIAVKKTPASVRELRRAAGIVLVLLVLSAGYGSVKMRQSPTADSEISVAVVQGNIRQELKWQEAAWPAILEKYLDLTKDAARRRPDLIIWPETSFPGILWEDEKYFSRIQQAVSEIKIPLLLGAVVLEGDDYYNAAVLLGRDGQIEQQHNKVHLVPFGEYIPLRPLFPFLSRIVPIADFTAGEEFTMFRASKAVFGGVRVHTPAPPFAVLICFEDTLSGLTRRFVRAGARLFVNMTNDAWFEDTKAPFMHLQGSVFRAVEYRRALVRAANTGVSAFIDPFGRIKQSVRGQAGKMTFISGHAQSAVPFISKETFYTKFGDVFTYLCFGCILISGWFCQRGSKPGIRKKEN